MLAVKNIHVELKIICDGCQKTDKISLYGKSLDIEHLKNRAKDIMTDHIQCWTYEDDKHYCFVCREWQPNMDEFDISDEDINEIEENGDEWEMAVVTKLK